jgi:hypothetical protein
VPVDALTVINQSNVGGALLGATDAFGAPNFDIDGDGSIAAADALTVINFINAQPRRRSCCLRIREEKSPPENNSAQCRFGNL